MPKQVRHGVNYTQRPTVNSEDVATATSTIKKIHGPITQAAYDALTPAADTLYIIVG